MKLIRHVALPHGVKRKINGPVPGGTFWALDGAHDLPNGPMAFGDIRFMAANGTVWMTDAFATQPWTVIVPDALPDFRAVWRDDYDGCAVSKDVSPFMPQFYFVPRNRRGRRFVDRAITRAHTRHWRKT